MKMEAERQWGVQKFHLNGDISDITQPYCHQPCLTRLLHTHTHTHTHTFTQTTHKYVRSVSNTNTENNLRLIVLGNNKKCHHGYCHDLPHGYHDNQGQEIEAVTLCIMSTSRSSNKLLGWNSICGIVYTKECQLVSQQTIICTQLNALDASGTTLRF